MDNKPQNKPNSPHNQRYDQSEELILVGIFDQPDKGILLAQNKNGLIQLPGGLMFKNFDLRVLTSQTFREKEVISRIIYEKTGYLTQVKTLIALFHFLHRKKAFKAFLVDLSQRDYKKPGWRKNLNFRTIWLKHSEISDNKRISFEDKQILLNYLQNKSKILGKDKPDSPFTEIITIAE